MMEANEKDYYSLSDIINQIESFLHYLRGKWWMLILASCIGAGLGTIYFFIQKPKYEAICTFILEEKSAGGGSLAGLASQYGFDIGQLTNGGSIFAGDNILEILKSKKIINKVLLSKANNIESSQGTTLADIFLNFKGWRKKWAKDPELKEINYTKILDVQELSPKQDSVLNLIHEFLLKKSLSAERLNKKGSLIMVKVAAPNSLFARLLTVRLVNEAASLYLEIKTGTAQANIAQMQRRSDSLLYLLNRKSYTVAASQPLDINPGVKSAIVPVEIASRDKTVLATLYAEVTKNLEASKLLLSQQTPIIQMLDKPSLVLEDNKFKITFLLLFSAIASGLIYVIGAFFFYFLKQYDTGKLN